MNGKIVTNDFNLNKVAQLRGVPVLNINELANSLKPVVLPGEVLRVFIIKEGKEQGQGVAYLDDGTMVVVDQARRALGKTIEVSVTSVLQTTAGKMIFCRWAEAGAAEDPARRDTRPPERRDPRGNGGRDYRGSERRDERLAPIPDRPVTVATAPLSTETAASEAPTAPIPVTAPTASPAPAPAAAGLVAERPVPKGD
jgi:TRAM domain